ncbi:WAT1-related protein [Oopsacas minuta]|uniref:WAT1-related protein n=1 Tax=Oopsacas minuta TaxID=111878 RepID=A0AAV7KJW4_9METZ|nr:WAT1-related protein [Oopsacas minuta]
MNKVPTKSTANFAIIVLVLVTAQSGFGLYPVLARKLQVGSTANPLIFCMLRDVCCVPVLVLLALISHGWIGLPKWRDWIVFLGLGITGIFLGQVLYLLAVTFVGANIASIFQQIVPIWTIILTIITCTEKVPHIKSLSTWLKLAGILFAVIGAIEMSLYNSTSQEDTNSPYYRLGYMLLFVNTLLTSTYYVCQKRLIFDAPKNRWRSSPVWVLAWSYLTGSICISLASLYYVKTPSALYLSKQEWIALIYAIFIASGLCYVLLTWANSQTSTSVVLAFSPLQAISSFIGSYLINSEVLNSYQYIGAVLIITGLLAVVSAKYLDERSEIIRLQKEQHSEL